MEESGTEAACSPGRRYYQYIHPIQVKADSAVWPASYTLAEMPWMLDNLTNENHPI